MKLTLVNFQSEEEIDLDVEHPVIIGRGSLFGCSDKKVSRNHGKVQLTPEGNVLLIALHSNPCFFMRNGLPPVLQIAKDQEQLLKSGDYIGLLPDSFWYKIVVKNTETDGGLLCSLNYSNITRDKSQSCEQVELSEGSPISVDDTLVKNYEKHEVDSSKIPGTNEEARNYGLCGKSEQLELSERLKALEKTKKLSLSMYEIDDFPREISKSSNVHQQLCGFLQGTKTHLDNNVTCEKDLSAVTSAVTHLGKINNGHIDDGARLGEQLNINVSRDNVQIQQTNVENIAHSSKAKVIEVKINDDENGTEDSNLKPCHSRKRPVCQYERTCYRKNEEHRREFCHPGDPDFVPFEKRPKCQFGAACYRRNKIHRVEYRHPEPTKPKGERVPKGSPRRKRQKKDKEPHCEKSEEDEYDLEDPFINDGSSSDEFIPSDFRGSDDDTDESAS